MKKIKLLLISIFAVILLICFGNTIYAAETMNLNITDKRPYTSKTYTVKTLNDNLHTVFKIGKRNVGQEELSYENSLYCLRSGLGFGNSEYVNRLGEVEDVTYTETYNLKTQANEVMNYYRNTIGYTNISNVEYNSILWIIDNMYLPEHKDSEAMKAKLLERAKVVNPQDLTDDDIEFVQQMALWYFANYDENGEANALSLLDTYVLSNATKIDAESLSETKATQIDTLYRYFIDNAKNNVNNYGTGESRELTNVKPEINVNDNEKSISQDEINNCTVVGPFNITEKVGNVDYEVLFKIKDNNGIEIPEKQEDIPVAFVVSNPTDMVQSANSISEMIGKGDFYLKIPNLYNEAYDLTDVDIEPEISYEKIYKTTATLWIAEAEDQPVLKIEREEVVDLKGKFNININKLDEKGNLLAGAEFVMAQIGNEGQRTAVILDGSTLGIFKTSEISITSEGQEFIFDIEETTAPGGYIGINGAFRIKVKTKLDTNKNEYVIDEIKLINTNGEETTIPEVTYEITDNTITLKVENKKVKAFDLALRKRIIKINDIEIPDPNKEPNIDTTSLINGTTTTAEYKHRKDPIEVKKGDFVTYRVSVYNEGDISGDVTKIIDYLSEGLEFDEEKTNAINNENVSVHYDETTNAIYIEETETENPLMRIKEFNSEEDSTLPSSYVDIVCKVTAETTNTDQILTNIATMEYKPTDAQYAEIKDRDSSSEPSNLNLPTNKEEWEKYSGKEENKLYLGDTEYYYKGQEDDDDFDKVIIKGIPFDLSLRKFITKINGKEITARIPEIDTSKLNTTDTTTGKKITTATYTHSKEPVTVKKGDIVTFTIRVYNEGELNGYATKIADYIPEGLGYLMDYKANTDNFWKTVIDNDTTVIDLVGKDGVYTTENIVKNLKAEDFNGKTSLNEVKILTGNAKIYSDALEDELIKAYNLETTSEDIEDTDNWQQSTKGTDGLYYKDVEVTCIVLAENTFKGTLKNIAEVMEDKPVDEDGNPISVTDRDSTPDNVDKNNYNAPADNSTYQQDDDDYEPLELKYFDLALRKFITAVNDEAVTTRIPKPTINEDGNLEYVHDKTPVYVANSDLVTYTIRVYNEGTVLGYATEISDDIPDGLVFLPEHNLNKEYEWTMYDENGEETDDPLKAVEIRTKYLENTLLNTYDSTKEISETEPFNPDYAEVKVIFQVLEQNITQEDRIVINKAQITEDKAVEKYIDEDGKEKEREIDIEDEDSIPNEWNEGEDDQDIEKIYVKKFDLALLKWVTQTRVTVDGKTTTTDTGFTPYDNPEPIAKVVIDKKKLSKTTVKFAYNIIIMNQGEIAGYATEITDYIPEGLEFVAEDNPIWTKAGDGKITTRALENKLLQPGETATVEVIFTWKKDANNLGIKTNIAEISEDYNEKGAKDIDSTPDNVETKEYDKQQEDDDDKALVMLELKTGGTGTTYLGLSLTVLAIISGGIILIKKYVI